MKQDQKRKLRNIAILSLLGLIGGTFAFTAFNQQAINDRENQVEVNVGGRVHDYYNRDTENKDVFVENYGERPIMARIRLSEFLEYQRGEGDFIQLVEGSEHENLESWTTYIPEANSIGTRTGDSAVLNRYSNLRFGRAGTAPWYLPTFNHNNLDLSTAAAGDARDYITDGATHPGDGTDDFWSEDDEYTNGDNGITWPGSATGTREAAQNLEQKQSVITLQQWNDWSGLAAENKVGNFWVVDHETGWAYWASLLEPGEASSYLLDAAEMTDAIEDTVFNGSYYYGIHVDSELISSTQEFSDEAANDSEVLNEFLQAIRNGAMHDDGVNPGSLENSSPSDFNFETMRAGRIFTMGGEQYRYLEDMGDGNHLIIRNAMIPHTTFWEQETVLTNWFASLNPEVKSIVQPVAETFVTGSLWEGNAIFTELNGNPRWTVTNLPEIVAEDLTKVDWSGTPRAFALSLADMNRLTENGAFATSWNRVAGGQGLYTSWFLRTLGQEGYAWHIAGAHADRLGMLSSSAAATEEAEPVSFIGVRPALIINPSN